MGSGGNNRGICNGSDLDAQFLDEIFDRIKAAPITLAEDDKLREKEEQASTSVASSMSAAFGLNSDATRRKRAEAFSKEREAMVRSSVQAIRQGARPAFAAFRQDSATEEFSKPSPANKVAAAAQRCSRSPGVPAFECLFACAGADLPRSEAYRLRVARFKNISLSRVCARARRGRSVVGERSSVLYDAGRALQGHAAAQRRVCRSVVGLTAVPDCAENLGSAWLPVLRVASRVAHLRLLTTGARTDDAYFTSTHQPDEKEYQDRKLRDEESARALAAHSVLTDASLDELYARSTKLSAVGVERFVAELCAVSAAELSTGDPSVARSTSSTNRT